MPLTQYFEQLDMLYDCPLRVPFAFRRFIVVYEKLPVLHEIMFPKPSSHLLDILGDAPGEPFLVTDAGSTSADSLYVVTQTESGDNSPQDWLGNATHAKVLYNDHPRFGNLFAAALTSFYNA